MNILDVSAAINMNRLTTAKYLDILMFTGYVDMKNFGNSKVFYLSQRLPLSAILSLSSDFILILDEDLRVTNVNDKFLEFNGMEKKDVLLRNITTFKFLFDFTPHILDNIKDALDGNESTVDVIYKKGHDDYYFMVKFVPLIFENRHKGVTIIFVDVTERRRAEFVIRESEHTLRSIVEQSRDGILITDENGIITDYNTSMEHILCIKRKDALGKAVYDILEDLIPESKNKKRIYDNVVSEIKKTLCTGFINKSHSYFEIQISLPDKSERTVQLTNSPIRTENGFILCNIARDITELRESEKKYRFLTETSMAGVLIYQGENIVEVNHTVEKMTGYSHDELLKMKFWDIAHPNYRKLLKNSSKARQRGKTSPDQYEFEILTKTGSVRWVELNDGYINFKGKPSGVVTLYDINEHKNRIKALEASEYNLAKDQQRTNR
jgi:PAS domain S-box-containing protein